MSIPTCTAIARAVPALSPVSSTGASPITFRSAIAAALVGLGWSATANMARAWPSHAAMTAVWPCSRAAFSACFSTPGTTTRRSRKTSSRPIVTTVPPTRPVAPTPGMARNSSSAGRVPSSASAARAIARAIGCSLPFSTAPTSESASSRRTPSMQTTSTSVISPVVTVPVLSSTTVSMRRVLCSTSIPLMTMPICAARPLPTISAVGVARPSAHGHAMISTATAALNAASVCLPADSPNTSVRNEIANTTGTNTALTLSATRCTGAFVACASRTSLAMRAKVVSEPTRVARTSRRPFRFTVAAVTESPRETSAGTLSPVIMLTSTEDAPSSTVPSTAIFSPGRTTTMSSTRTTDAGMDTSTPSRSTVACLAPSASNARSASPAECFAFVSR